MAGNDQATLAWLGESSRLRLLLVILQFHLSSGQEGRERLGREKRGEEQDGVRGGQSSHKFVRQDRKGGQRLGGKTP